MISEELAFLLQTTIVQGLVFTFLAMLVLGILLRYYMLLKRHELEISERRAHIDRLRSQKEEEIYQRFDDISRTEDRWKELNHLPLGAGETLDEVKQLLVNNQTSSAISPDRFLKRMGLNPSNLPKVQRNEVFFLTPFHERFENTYKTVLEAGASLGLKVYRGDEEFETGVITQQIIRNIVSAQFIVANLDGRNANVFYELGVASALGKAVIMIAHQKTETPFDIKSDRTLFWSDQRELEDKLVRVMGRTAIEASQQT